MAADILTCNLVDVVFELLTPPVLEQIQFHRHPDDDRKSKLRIGHLNGAQVYNNEETVRVGIRASNVPELIAVIPGMMLM